MTEPPSSKRVCRLVACAALLSISLLPSLLPVHVAAAATLQAGNAPLAAAAPTASSPTAAEAGQPVTVALASITPTISVPRSPVIITGTVRNTGAVAITSPAARALIGSRPLTSRQAVSGWSSLSSPSGGQPLTERARASLGQTLAPGAVAAFTLTIPATAITRPDSFAVLPLRVDVVAATSTPIQDLGGVQTFLPSLSATKRYEPLSIAWLVPLTLDPDPALHGTDSPARTVAWTKAIGPGSRLDKLIRGTDGTNVTWAIDPAILGPEVTEAPAAGASAKSAPTARATTTPTPGVTQTPDRVTEATTALASRLKAAAPRHTLWSLPYADPDLAAALPLASGNQAVAGLISRPTALDGVLAQARTDIAWPVEGAVNAQNEARLRRAFALSGLAAAVTSASTLTSRNGSTGDAGRKSAGGLPLLAYDEALSRTAAQTSTKALSAITLQQFLADSMALLGERPGTRNRSVLVALPRSFAGDPAVLRSFLAAVAPTPWLTPTTTEQLLAVAKELDPETPGDGATATATQPSASPSATPTAPDPLSPGISPLTSAMLASIPGRLSAINGIASIRDDAQPFQVRWTEAQDQLVSARWRGRPRGPAAITAATRSAITTVSRSVSVVPSSVNFFADRGFLQVTVVNNLEVPIHDVQLTLTPAQPRLRIEQQPEPLRIGAKSRTNVRLEVIAIAAGLVPIEAVLTTPNGTPLGQNARVDVRVQPTSTWIYWVLGGLASIVLVLGTYRSLRRGSTRAARPAAQELSFND